MKTSIPIFKGLFFSIVLILSTSCNKDDDSFREVKYTRNTFEYGILIQKTSYNIQGYAIRDSIFGSSEFSYVIDHYYDISHNFQIRYIKYYPNNVSSEKVTEINYDQNGNLINASSDNLVSEYKYNSSGKLIQSINYNGDTSKFIYDADNKHMIRSF
jgi:YD repeat-containing protein